MSFVLSGQQDTFSPNSGSKNLIGHGQSSHHPPATTAANLGKEPSFVVSCMGELFPARRRHKQRLVISAGNGLPGFEIVDGEATKRGVPVSELTREFASRFAKKRMNEGVGTAYINRSLACLRRMLRLAQDEGKIRVVPRFKFLPEPPARKGFLDDLQFEKLLNLLPTHLTPLIEFLYSSGVRLGEALQVTWGQVDFTRGTIRLEAEQTKSGLARTLSLSSRLSAMLHPVKGKKTEKVFDATNLRKEWERACDACGLGKLTKVEGQYYTTYSGLRLHDLRRSAVRNMVKEGVPQTVAMKISGHKTDAVFRRYAIVSDEDIREATRRVELARMKALKGFF